MNRMCLFLLAAVLLVAALPARADITAPGDPVLGVPDDGDWPGNEAPPLAIDDNPSTKYLHFKGNASSAGFRVTPSTSGSLVTGLTFTTANDAVERDPTAFELSGSNGSINGPYTLIAEGEIVDFKGADPWPRFTMNTTPITFANRTAYDHYQLLFTAIRDRASANSMQIAEVEFIAGSPDGLPPEVDAGQDRTIAWKGPGKTTLQLNPVIYDDDPCDLGATDPDYLTVLWSAPDQPGVNFMGTAAEPNAVVLFPAPGVYNLQLQVWDEHEFEGIDAVAITVIEPECPTSDLSGDCKVDFADVILYAGQWLDPEGCADPAAPCADLAGDSAVDWVDFVPLAASWRDDWTGSLRVTLTPVEAVTAGARWRIDGGSWQTSGTLISDLMPGPHTVEFETLADWIRPVSKTVQTGKGQTSVQSGIYSRLPDSALLITEFLAQNNGTYPTKVAGKDVFLDWIEIYNAGATAVNLEGWHLTDDPNDLTRWTFGDVSLGAESYMVVYASGIDPADHPENDPYADDYGLFHTNFELNSAGDYLALVRPDGQVAHEYAEYQHDASTYGYPPQVEWVSYGLYGNEKQFFTTPTPGKANVAGYAGISEPPQFSHPAGTFTGYMFLELTSSNPNAEIRYTLNGQIPDTTSARYVSPILVLDSKEVLARVYEPGKTPSVVASQTYVALAEDVASFSSDLPIVVVDTQKRGISGGALSRVQSVVIDRGADGRARILDPAGFAGRGALKVRGSSTAGSPKPQYAFEIWDEHDRDKDAALLGLPAESDWILYGPAHFDRALINNAFIYDLSNQVGRYAVHTRYVEMYLNRDGGLVSASDYVGLYILMEKPKRGLNRVNVEKLEPWDDREPKVAGGYMLKIDRSDPGDSGFRTARGNPTYGDGTLCYVEPKEREITTAQSAWIRGYLNEFEDALYGPNSADPQVGYARFIDVDSFIDHNLLNMLAMNVDALRLSTYLYKSRNGKLEMGPLWDFDRAMDSTDGRDDNPQSWHGTGDGTDYHHYVWWDTLFDDINFWQKYIDRWYALRQGAFSTGNINATIDGMADEIREAQVRNEQRWTSYRPRFGGFEGEMDHLKQWLQTRCTWVDNQFVAPPEAFPGGGHIDAATAVQILNLRGGGTIYYTLDGSDPRLPEAVGMVMDSAVLVPEAAAKRVLVPTGPVSDAWKSDVAFNDSAWSPVTGAPGGVGYERTSGYEPFLSLDLGAEMYGSATSFYIRIPFVLSDDPSAFNFMSLKMRYDDGFVAYLNGVEITRAQFSGTPAWDSSAGGNHDDLAAIRLEEFDVAASTGLLRQGQNLLAIHGLNSSTSSSDLLISAELSAGQSSNPSGSGIAATAHEYTGPITVTESTQITARILVASNPYSPWSGPARIVFAVGPVAESLRISEIMYHPADAGHPDDPNTEYIELTNVGAETINLNWVRFTNGIDFTFPSFELAPGDYCLVVKDVNAFEGRYGDGLPVAGEYEGTLSNGGERLELQDAGGGIIHNFQFRDGWYDVTDGLGFSLTVHAPAATDPNALGSRNVWRPSTAPGGTPGFGDVGAGPATGSVVINELLANPGVDAFDWVELHNPTDQVVDIGGWFLSDDADDLMKYEIAGGTLIEPGGYIVFYEDLHFGSTDDPGAHAAFGLSSQGETVYLNSASAGALTGYSVQEKFGASEPGVSLGRYSKSTGADNFVAQSEPTPGSANAYPQVGPIVINEIMYHPAVFDDAEYVELLNIGDAAVTLADAATAAPWRFTDDPDSPGVELFFPTDEPVTLEPGAFLLLVKDRAAFALAFNAPAHVRILEWGAGRLANGSEKIELGKPGPVSTDGTQHWVRVDRVVYSDGSHPEDSATGVDAWPLGPDGNGASLRRIVPSDYGNDVANWAESGTPSPGW